MDIFLSNDKKLIICQPRPFDAADSWVPDQAFLEKRTIYRLDHLLNPDSAITHSLIPLDTRPVMLARDPGHPLPCMIAISFKRKEFSLRIESAKVSIKFSEILKHSIKDTSWLRSDLLFLLEIYLHESSEVIGLRIAKAVRMGYMLKLGQ